MSPRFLLDENQRGPLWDAVQRYIERSKVPIDATRVGEASGPSLGADAPELLLWCEAAGRILISEDKKTLPAHLAAHLAAGHHSPGLLLIRPGQSVRSVVEFLALATAASDASEW